jgi:hypothetical protein
MNHLDESLELTKGLKLSPEYKLFARLKSPTAAAIAGNKGSEDMGLPSTGLSR